MKEITAHFSHHGWNYGLKIGKTKVQAFRYHTNGHQNSSYQFSPFFTKEEMEKKLGIEYLNSDTILTREDAEQIEGLLHRYKF